MRLLQSQKNELYDLITNSDYFSPSQFTISSNGEIIEYKQSEYFFRIFEDNDFYNSFIVNFSPGYSVFKDASSSTDWAGIKLHFTKWLNYLKREVTIPDKWLLLIEGISHLVTPTVYSKTKFDHSEYIELYQKIDQIKIGVSGIPLLIEQSTAISNQLDHLIEIANDLNKFDWQNLFVGTIISIIIQLNVTPENANLLYELIKKVFHGLFLQ